MPNIPDLIEKYSPFDIIVGKIANDRTAHTLQLYVAEAFGKPGSTEADSVAIATLLPGRLENQLCFRSPRAIDCLTYESTFPRANGPKAPTTCATSGKGNVATNYDLAPWITMELLPQIRT